MGQTKFVRIVLKIPKSMLEELARRADEGGWGFELTVDAPAPAPPQAPAASSNRGRARRGAR